MEIDNNVENWKIVDKETINVVSQENQLYARLRMLKIVRQYIGQFTGKVCLHKKYSKKVV